MRVPRLWGSRVEEEEAQVDLLIIIRMEGQVLGDHQGEDRPGSHREDQEMDLLVDPRMGLLVGHRMGRLVDQGMDRLMGRLVDEEMDHHDMIRRMDFEGHRMAAVVEYHRQDHHHQEVDVPE